MTEINTIADLAQALQEHPEWLKTIRGILLTEDLERLPAALSRLEGSLGDIRQELATVGGQVSNLTGDDYEGQAAHFGRRRLRDALDAIDVRLFYQCRRQGQQALQNMLLQARKNNGLAIADRDDLEDADLIFQVYGSRNPNLITSHVVAEASLTIKRDDVVRARRRAMVIDSITTQPASAAVIGTAISPEARQELERDFPSPVLAVAMAEDGQPCILTEAASENSDR